MARAQARKPSPVRRVLAARSRDALFDLSEQSPRLVEIDIAHIRPNPDQPRRQIDEDSIEELARSIDQHGLLQPIVVKPEGDDYLLVAGQRRLLAHQRLGRERITAVLTTGRPDELSLIENLQREALPPLDEAEALGALKERYGYTQEQLARVLAKAKSTISELLSLNELPAEVKEEVRQSPRPISKSVLIEIARQADDEARLLFWRQLDGVERPTVRQARASRAPRRAAAKLGTLRCVGTARRLLEELGRIEQEQVRGDAALRKALQALRDRLDGLL